MNALPPAVCYGPRRVAVFGVGLSGRAAARLCTAIGIEFQIYDEGGQGDSCEFTEADINQYDGFIFSPGFAADHPWRVLAERSNRLCFSELGFAMWLWRGKVIGVTGTNGKTTVTTLLKCALEALGQKAVTAGNIGHPLSELWLEHGLDDNVWAICEISSFQAELPLGIDLQGLVWTNFAEDHLDRYASMQAYFDAKAQLLNCLQSGGRVVLGDSVKAWDPNLTRFDVVQFQGKTPQLAIESPFASYPQAENYKLVAQLWAQLGLPSDALETAANNFQLAPHRLTMIAEWGGVRFWNDSKATNFSAALAALDAVEGPIYWVAGGRSKEGDLAAFARSGAAYATAVFLYGEVAEDMAAAMKSCCARVEVHPRFTDAVVAASKAAFEAPPASVLLSPGFASFDQFTSYAERGESFISAVLSLKDAALRS